LDKELTDTIEEQVQDDQTHLDITAIAQLVYNAGLDLLLLGLAEDMARLFKRYQELLLRWKFLDEENRNNLKTFIESVGRQNPFKNHLLLD
jgi:hypothetical protein